jgi:hypothetical protein
MMGWLNRWISGWFRRGLPKGQTYAPWHGRDGHHPASCPNIFPMRGRHGKYFSRFKVS